MIYVENFILMKLISEDAYKFLLHVSPVSFYLKHISQEYFHIHPSIPILVKKSSHKLNVTWKI